LHGRCRMRCGNRRGRTEEKNEGAIGREM
jgi:hypothetical protein